MNNNRIQWIDIVRGICIFCVVLTHVETCPDTFRWFFSPYYMPMFFFLSGVVYKPSSNVTVAILQPVTKILWPYVISAVIFAFGSLGWIRTLLDTDYIGAFNMLFHNAIVKPISGKVLWFLASLFIVQMLGVILLSVFNLRKRYLTIITFLCFMYIFCLNGQEIAPWSANTALLALGYFLLGYLLKDKLRAINLLGSKRLIGPIALLVYFVILYVVNTSVVEPLGFDMHCNRFSSNPIWFLCLSLMGIFSVCAFAMSIGRCKTLEYIGASSLIVYIYHGYSGFFAKHLLGLFAISRDTMAHSVYTLLFAVTSMVIVAGIVWVINNYFLILIGRGATIKRIQSYLVNDTVTSNR